MAAVDSSAAQVSLIVKDWGIPGRGAIMPASAPRVFTGPFNPEFNPQCAAGFLLDSAHRSSNDPRNEVRFQLGDHRIIPFQIGKGAVVLREAQPIRSFF